MTATLDSDAAPSVAPSAASVLAATADEPGERLGRGAALGLGTAVLWLSLLVLIPLAAVVAKGFEGGWSGFWAAVTRPIAIHALILTVVSSLVVALVNAVTGTLIAWVLVRDRFRGRRAIDLVIDIPFALPTIVAGLVLLSVYGTDSPVGISLYGTQFAIVFALMFVTLPFVVRSVQPVLLALDPETEQAAACLGASPLTTFRRILLPVLLPAIASGAALAFARAMGEYGSVLLIGGGLNNTKVSSMYAYDRIQAFDYQGAAATATVLLVVSLLVIIGLDVLQRRVARRG
jgi:sulfate transport system permease protein